MGLIMNSSLKRPGSATDVEKLTNCFRELNFQFYGGKESYNDLAISEMSEIVQGIVG